MPIHIPHPITNVQPGLFPESKGNFERTEKKQTNSPIGLAINTTPTDVTKNAEDNEKSTVNRIIGGDMDIPRSGTGSSFTSTGFDYEETNY